jgi:hypothetical protein
MQNVDSGPPSAPKFAELWYSVHNLLVHIELDPADGTVLGIQSSRITTPLPLGQNAITMLDSGTLLGARLAGTESTFYYITNPPTDGSDVAVIDLGVMPGGIMVEGLYTDCDGRLYAMDTGVDDTSATGNRLLRFTGDVLAGNFEYVVVSNLATAVVADIDDMSPGIMNNQITDNPGYALDTGNLYNFDYETGTGTMIATAGTFGVHALGGVLFDDGRSRLYVLTSDANLHEVDPTTFTVSPSLGQGPAPTQGTRGWSGLAGPLTDCMTGFNLI